MPLSCLLFPILNALLNAPLNAPLNLLLDATQFQPEMAMPRCLGVVRAENKEGQRTGDNSGGNLLE